MVKPRKTPMMEDWILIALSNSTDRFGINLTNWYHRRRPDNLEIDFNDFWEVIHEMMKRGLIKRSTNVAENYCLTDLGKKRLDSIPKTMTYDAYYSMISKFPELELRERLGIVENIILGAFGVILILFLGSVKIHTPPTSTEILVMIGYATLTIIIFLYGFVNILKFSLLMIFRLKENSLWKFREWLWNNKKLITYGTPILAFLLFSIILNKFFDFEIKTIIAGTIMTIVSSFILNYGKIAKQISEFLDKLRTK